MDNTGNIMIIADLHAHSFQEFATVSIHSRTGLPINSRLNDLLVTLTESVESAIELGCKSVIIAGDLYHKRASVPTDVSYFVYDFVKWMVHDKLLKVFMLTGNHDQQDRSGAIHSLHSFSDICIVIDSPVFMRIEGVPVKFVPYMERTDDIKEALNDVRHSAVDLLVCHAGVEGAFVGSIEYRIKSPIKIEDLHIDRYKYVVLGHYHKAQNLTPTVLYVGSPAQVTRAEVGDEKRFLVYNPKQKSMSSHLTYAPEFKTVTDVELAEGNLDSKHYYDVVVTGEAAKDVVESKTSDLQTKLVKPKIAKVLDSRIELTELMTDEDILKSYAAYKGAPARWLPIGKSILSKVEAETSPYTNIEFLSMIAENFLTIGKVKLKLNRPGRVTAVLGNNQSRESYSSNGAGKSALLPEAIFWCLYGKTARKVPADKVVNNTAKRNCYVRILLKLDKDKLQITRFRKHKALGGTGLHLQLNGKDITEGTPELTEIKLASLIGIDYTTFSSVVAFSPDNLRFVSSTDGTQKQVLDSILQTKRFTAALGIAKAIQDTVKQSRLNSVREVDKTNGVLESSRETQSSYESKNAAFLERQKTRLADIMAEIALVIEAKERKYEELEAVTQGIIEANEICDDLKAGLVDTAVLAATKKAADEQVVKMRTIVAGTEAALKAKQEQLASAIDQAGKPCPTCGVPVANTGKLIANLQTDRNRIQRQLERESLALVSAKEAASVATTALTNMEAKWEAHYDRCRAINNKQRSKENCERQIRDLNQQIAALDLSKDSKEINEYDTLLPEINSKIALLEETLTRLEKEINKYDAQLSALEFWNKAFGIAGIRSFLLDQIMPDLTQYANEFSEILTGGGTLIEFASFNEETMKDKFEIRAWNQDGSDVYVGNSSGEKRRIDICVMFALFKIAHSRTKVNILLLDEVLDTLDESGIETIPLVLDKLAQELRLSVYVTSHTTLKDMIHDSITVVKNNGMSHLEDN